MLTDSAYKMLIDYMGTLAQLGRRARCNAAQCVEYHDLDGSQRWSNVAVDAGNLKDSLGNALKADRGADLPQIEEKETA